jgi:hypothetical protein
MKQNDMSNALLESVADIALQVRGDSRALSDA